MNTVVVGGGPVGMVCALALSRRGHRVTVVDRDPGPSGGSERWERRGVMQFDHPHAFRSALRNVLLATVPELWDALIQAGGVPACPDGFPDAMTNLHCRRSTLERTIWNFADRDPGLTRITGHADEVQLSGDRVTGIVVDGQPLEADVVIVATGRSGRFADDLRAPAEGGACGFSYVSRMYRALPGHDIPHSPTPLWSACDGYHALIFPQDGKTLSALLVRATDDTALAEARHTAIFDRLAAVIPQLASWTDPAGFEPITGVMVGGALHNTYRGQRDQSGAVAAAGLFFVGDAVCTTNPAAGRGVALGMRQVEALLGFLDGDADHRSAAAAFDDWCTENVRPWFEDHVYWDRTLLARYDGADIDIDGRIPSDVVCAAAEVDTSMWPHVGPYLGMLAPPSILDPVQENARAVLRAGWRPRWADGPSRRELADLVFEAAA